MKIFKKILIVILIFSGLCSSVSANDFDLPMNTAEASKGTPVIDGTIDPIWQTTQTIATERFKQGVAGARAYVRVLWDDKNLYVLMEVFDNVISTANEAVWLKDGVEIYIDENNGKTFLYQDDDSQYRITYDKKASSEDIKFAVVDTEDGYMIEAAFPFKTIKPTVNTIIGFDAQVNDDPGTGAREAISAWNDYDNVAYQDTSVFGELTLVEKASDLEIPIMKEFELDEEGNIVISNDISVNVNHQFQTVRAHGGNYAKGRDGNANFGPSRDTVKEIFINDIVGEYVLKNLPQEIARVGFPLNVWESVNDNDDPFDMDLSKFKDVEGVTNIFKLMQELKKYDLEIIGSIWAVPSFMRHEDPRSISSDMYDEFSECLTAFLVKARDTYGVDVEYVSLNEPNLAGNVFQQPQEYNEIIKASQKHFEKAGLKTKWLLGGCSTVQSSVRYCMEQVKDEEVLPLVAAISYNAWDHLIIDSSWYKRLAQIADDVNLELWCIEANYTATIPSDNNLPGDYMASWDRAINIIDNYNSIMKYGKTTTTVYWEFQNDLRLVSSDTAEPFHSFYVMEQFLNLFRPGDVMVNAASGNPNLIPLASRGKDSFSLQIMNTTGNASIGKTARVGSGEVYEIAPEANIIRYGDFEKKAQGWNAPPAYKIVSDEKHSGEYSMFIEGSGEWMSASTEVSVKPNTDYLMTWYAKGTQGYAAIVKAVDSNEVQLCEANFSDGSNEWKQYSTTFNSGKSKKITITAAVNEGDRWIDDITLSTLKKEQALEDEVVISGVPNGTYEVTSCSMSENYKSLDNIVVTDNTIRTNIKQNSILGLKAKVSDFAQIEAISPKMSEMSDETKPSEVKNQDIKIDESRDISVYVDGEKLEFDQKPVMAEGRVLVPMRLILETLGCTVEWDQELQMVTAEYGMDSLSLQIGNKMANITKGVVVVPTELDVPALLYNSRTLVPIRFISEAVGAKVDWEEESSSVIITKN